MRSAMQAGTAILQGIVGWWVTLRFFSLLWLRDPDTCRRRGHMRHTHHTAQADCFHIATALARPS